MRVTFNVGGTRFETHVSTITNGRKEPLDLLNMLLDHRVSDKDEIFIDRDSSSFQSILNIYRGCGRVELDADELDFFGLIEKEEPRKKTRRDEIEEKLQKIAKKRKRVINQAQEDALNKYADILDMVLKNGPLTFVYAGEHGGKPFSTIPCTLNGTVYPEQYFSVNKQELDKYAASLGYRIGISSSHMEKSTKYDQKPASAYNGSFTNRQKTVIRLNLTHLN